MRQRLRLFTVLALFSLAAVLHAQGPGPERVAEMQMAAVSRSDWSGFTSFMHPDALESFKAAFAEILSMDGTGEAGSGLFGVSDLAQYQQASAADLFTLFMQRLSEAAPEMMMMTRGARYQVLGAVLEGPELAHVVYRLTVTVDDTPFSSMEVETYRKHGGQWKSMLRREIDQLVAGIRQSIAEQE